MLVCVPSHMPLHSSSNHHSWNKYAIIGEGIIISM